MPQKTDAYFPNNKKLFGTVSRLYCYDVGIYMNGIKFSVSWTAIELSKIKNIARIKLC